MGSSDWLSYGINLLVGGYFVFLYPKTLVRSFRDRPIPPGFVRLRRALFWLGWTIILGSTVYVGYRLIVPTG